MTTSITLTKKSARNEYDNGTWAAKLAGVEFGFVERWEFESPSTPTDYSVEFYNLNAVKILGRKKYFDTLAEARQAINEAMPTILACSPKFKS